MKYFLCFAVVFLIVAGACQQKSSEHHHDPDEKIQASPNQALYEEVMAIHNEVMPRMNDLYKRKNALKKQLDTSGLSEGEKNEIAEKIARIDSANEGMMVWMRQFNPIPDSLGEDKARQYLESEMVKVKKVKDDILAALKDAEPAN
jgi:hypothetical protein